MIVVVVVVEIEEVDEGKHCVLQSKGRATINTDTHTHNTLTHTCRQCWAFPREVMFGLKSKMYVCACVCMCAFRVCM